MGVHTAVGSQEWISRYFPSPPLEWMARTLLQPLTDELQSREFFPTCCVSSQEGASLVAQWLGICLPTQETWVRALVWERSHMPWSNWACEPQLLSCASGACAPQQERPRQ